jgi:hypothetical protein
MSRKINKKLLCPICDYEATIICSGCESVGYCNAEHQRAHLKVHELSCKPCKEERDSHTGKLHFLACQNFKSGKYFTISLILSKFYLFIVFHLSLFIRRHHPTRGSIVDGSGQAIWKVES